MVPGADVLPKALAPRKPSNRPDPLTGSTCPPATMLSGMLGCGQAKSMPPDVTVCPGANPPAASACAE
jgi:hypothetical protein